jgi:hypothetical protein
MSGQTAMVLPFPAQDQMERISRTAWSIMMHHAGRERAIHRARLATEVRQGAGLMHLTNETMQRRLRETCDAWLDEGRRIVQTRDGYYLPLTAEEIAEGDKAIARPAFSRLRKLAKYRRVTLPELLRLMGQMSASLGEG